MSQIYYSKKLKEYTLKEEVNGEKTRNPKPAKYSPEDKYGKYRRIKKKNDISS